MSVTPTPLRWLADRDGEAHAVYRSRDPRTLCGRLAVSERLAWPSKRRCPVCVARVTELATSNPALRGRRKEVAIAQR